MRERERERGEREIEREREKGEGQIERERVQDNRAKYSK